MDTETVLTSLFTLTAGIGIFLIACNMMSSNLEALGSGKLKALFAKASKSKLLGVGVGTAATAIIQSSSATTVMVIGFVNAGIMTLSQAATVIFGANIGTTITGQLVALGMSGSSISASVFFAAFAGIGAFTLTFAKKDRTQKFGGILAGFGMLFAGLSMMSGAMSSFSELEAIRQFLAQFRSSFLLVLAGMVLTAVMQSSSVMTTMAITMVTTGLISLNQGIYITMGSNIGTCMTALIAGLTSTKNAKRTAYIHLIFNVSGVVIFMLLGSLLRFAGTSFGHLFQSFFPRAPQLQLSMFHTIFNVTTVILVLPLTDFLTELAAHLVPDTAAQQVDSSMLHLTYVNEHMLATPPVAVQQVKNEVIHMAKLSIKNFDLSCHMVCTLDQTDLKTFQDNEAKLDYLNRELARFIAQLLKADLNEEDRVYLSTAFRSITDFERIGDYAENIVEYATHLLKEKESFSSVAIDEIKELQHMIANLFQHTMTTYRNYSREALEKAYEIEDAIDDITVQMAENHIRRLGDGVCTPDVGAQYLSLASNVERIADHLINVAKTSRALH